MITEMRLVNITGPRDDIDRMADRYLTHYPIHLENALKELSEIRTLRPYTSPNPYEPWEERIDNLLDYTNVEHGKDIHLDKPMTFDQAKALVNEVEESLQHEREAIAKVQAAHDEANENLLMFRPFQSIDFTLDKIYEMNHIKFRFGRFTRENYRKFEKYVDTMVPAIFVKSEETEKYVYGVYFTPDEARQRVDALLFSLAWERIYLPEESGSFREITHKYQNLVEETESQLIQLKRKMRALVTPVAPDLLAAKSRLIDLSQAFGVRKFAAITREEFAQKETRYLLIGWMAQSDAQKFSDEVKKDPNVTMYIEDEDDNSHLNPPTKMKNNFLIRPFELLTKMYGVPNYREIDPTAIVGISYSLLFGAMFGDVGQGLILFLVGLVGFFNKKLRPIGMLAPIGLSSTIFGFLYGSIFGFEDVIHALWLHPMTHMTDIPFFGSLNTVFIVAVAFGMFMILATMIVNIVQRFNAGEKWEAILDKNGIAGFIFYFVLVAMLILYMSGHTIPAIGILIAILALALITIAFKEEIIHKLENHKEKNGDNIVIQALTIFFETFETLLTYFSNSISFVRVGAFAISHGAMMSVVLMFAGAENSGNINWLVIILGNLFVTGFEGLVVAIQVLRLEFYEIFSHFYRGDGIEFKNIWIKD
ncbi:MAG: V-type ATPase 116kDa subunit family protein [Aerococcus urinaeequi]